MLLPCRPLLGYPWDKILTLKNIFVMGRFHCHPSICGRKQNYKLRVRGFNTGRRHSWYRHIVVKQGYVSYQWFVERLNRTCRVSLASSVSFISSNECAMHHAAFTTLRTVLPCKIPHSAFGTSIQKYSNKTTASQKCVFRCRVKALASWIFKAKSTFLRFICRSNWCTWGFCHWWRLLLFISM